MEPLSLKVLNNQIVSMRKDVRKAVVHQIHHLTTAAKRLRNRKGSDEEKQKNGLKADNTASEITIFKGLKPDDVSEFGLMNYEENGIKNFISKKIIAPETKAMAKLCLRKNLRTVIDDFISGHSEEVHLLQQLLEERFRNKKKKKKKRKKKGNKDILEDKTNEISNNSDSGESVPELVAGSSSESTPSDLDNINDSDIKGLNNSINTEKMDIADLVINQGDKLPKSSSEAGQTKVDSNNILTEKNCMKKNESCHLDKGNNKAKITQIGTAITEKHPPQRKNVDPFFITKDNSTYHTYCNVDANSRKEIEEIPKEKLNPKSSSKEFKKDLINRRENQKNNFLRNNNQYQKFNKKKTITHLGGSQKWASKDGKKFGKYPSQDIAVDVKLHPSWEAKKKLSISSAPFEGKKITFED